jgi:phosphinothricin acetyltransferase
MLRAASADDAEAIARIYNHYVRETIVTFETEPVGVAEMARRIGSVAAKYDWLVAEAEGKLAGYAYYGQFRTRAAYDHTVESTVYVAHDGMGKGVGKALYTELLRAARRRGYREVLGVIALPNPASLALHAAMGFVEVGLLKRVGFKFGEYIDVGLWQVSL